MSTPAAEHVSIQRFHALASAIIGPDDHPWHASLAALLEAASRGVGSLPAPAGLADPPPCVVRDGDAILLPRTHAAWQRVRSCINQRRATPPPRFPHDLVARHLDHILPAQEYHRDPNGLIIDNSQQRLAAALLVDAPVGVLTGGPGTGKTTSAAALLALALALDADLQADAILVCAPTGKAANRLRQSLRSSAARLNLDARQTQIISSLRPSTIHSALSWTPKAVEDGGPWRHHGRSPLRQRLVIMDEASMADVELFAALVDALHPDSRLLILGDRDQLDSVQAGGVLAELVARGAAADLPAELADLLRQRCGAEAAQMWRKGLPPLAHSSQHDSLPGLAAGLSMSFRAMAAPWILRVAELVRPGSNANAEALRRCLRQHDDAQLRLLPTRQDTHLHCIQHWLALRQVSAQWHANQPPDNDQLQAALDQHQLIVVSNQQVQRANALGHHLLRVSGAALDIDPASILPQLPRLPAHARMHGPLWHGTPIILQANDRGLDLANGDIGMALGAGLGQPASVAVFPGRSDAPLPLARLSDYRSAHAITIHKSQGSEWAHVSIDLPAHAGDLLDRRLLYTAITRASQSLALHPSGNSLSDILDPAATS